MPICVTYPNSANLPPTNKGGGRDDGVTTSMHNIALFEAWQRKRHLSAATMRCRRQRLEGLARWLRRDDRALLEAEPADIEEWLDSLGGDGGLAPQTREGYIRQLAAFYRWAVRSRLVVDDPTDDVVRPQLPRALPRPMDPADLVRALGAACDRKAAMLALAAYAGLRCQEIAGLRAEDIDWRAKRLLVTHGKGRRERVVPMHPELARHLRTVAPSHGFVFHRIHPLGPDPIKPGTVSQFLSEFLRSQGISASAHNGRHLFLTSVYEVSLDIRVTQELAGHASPTTTARYAAWSQARGAEAVSALSYG